MKIYFSRVNFPKLLFTHRYAESTPSAARAKSKLDAESYVNKTESVAFARTGAQQSRLPRTHSPRALWVPVLFPPRPLCSAAPGSSFRNFSLFSRDCLQASYDQVYRASVQEPENLWSEAAGDITWFKPWTKTMDNSNPPFTNWFVDGELNICYNALDRHIENGRGDQAAVIHDSPVTNTKEIITYREMHETVCKLAGVLVKHGVRKGDRVVIYMPMVPQAMFTMLACARLGAIHSLIFGGFASKELAIRIDHVKAKFVVTASFGVEPGRRVEYIPLLERALDMVHHKPEKVLIYQRPNMEAVPLAPGRDLDWNEELAKAHPHDCVPVLSDHPLYVLYTSGTTGMPKGVVRTTGGYAVMLNWTMSAVYGLKPGEVWWAASDLGWVVGHSYICYAPLLHGNTSILYEVGECRHSFNTWFMSAVDTDENGRFLKRDTTL